MNNPVKFRLRYEKFLGLSSNSQQLNLMRLRPNIVRKFNGFEQNMYTLKFSNYLDRQNQNSFYPCIFEIIMDEEYDYYQHYINYQPQSPPIDRTLNIDDIDKMDDIEKLAVI